MYKTTKMIKIVTSPISKKDLKKSAHETFVSLVKAVVDIEQNIIAIGGDLHADEEAILIEKGSNQKDLWGINIYPEKPEIEWIEFDSMINIRPSQGNRSRSVEDQEIRDKIMKIVKNLINE
jgi:Icc-related predicted phosphoesterase